MHNVRSRWQRVIRALAHGALVVIAFAAGLVILAWFIGYVITDRYVWSQWLWWIPTPAALAAAVIGLLCACRPARVPRRRKRRIMVWAVVTTLTGIEFLVVHHHFVRTQAASRNGLHIVHLNAWHARDVDTGGLIESLMRNRGDITVFTSNYKPAWNERIAAEGDEDLKCLSLGPFTVVTALEVESLQPVAFTRDGISIVLLTVHANAYTDHPVTVYMVDLPSDPNISRWSVATKVRRFLDTFNAAAPDVVLGDFNITRRSASIDHMLPAFHHAYQDAGHGYAATFHRAFPLYHIDHILLSKHWRATEYRLIDPGVGRHMMQSAHIVPSRSFESENK